MPTVAMTVNTGSRGNEPISTRNSVTNEFVPGSASDESPASRKHPASTGASFPTPP